MLRCQTQPFPIQEHDTMSDDTTTSAIHRARAPGSEFLDGLRVGEELYGLLEDPHDPQARAELDKMMAMTLSQGYPMIFHASPEHPDLVPYLNATFNSAGPNPDNVYLISPISPQGTYRLHGNRGSVLLGTVTIGASSGPGRGLWMEDLPGPLVGQTDFGQIALAPDGSFEILISRERPAGHNGNWLELSPRADHLLVRQTSYDWDTEENAFVALDRIDAPSQLPRPTREQIADNLRLLTNFVLMGSRYWLDYMKQLRTKSPVNALQLTDYWSFGGIATQVYIDGYWSIREDECVLIEADLPKACRYWNFQLADPLFLGIDLTNRQTSLNGRQAHIDRDGRFRAVICARDPGIANWLDTGGFHRGGVIGRWLEASDHPTPTMRLLKLSELDAALPPETARVTAEQRQRTLRARRAAVQRWRRW